MIFKDVIVPMLNRSCGGHAAVSVDTCSVIDTDCTPKRFAASTNMLVQYIWKSQPDTEYHTARQL